MLPMSKSTGQRGRGEEKKMAVHTKGKLTEAVWKDEPEGNHSGQSQSIRCRRWMYRITIHEVIDKKCLRALCQTRRITGEKPRTWASD